jgi:hypothetical protein
MKPIPPCMPNSPNAFQKILRQIIGLEPKPTLNEEEINFDVLSLELMELVCKKYVA